MTPSIEYYPAALSHTPFPTKKPPQVNISVIELSDDEQQQQQQTQTDPLDSERIRLRRHLGLGDNPGDAPTIQPLFFIERVPDTKSVSCSLPGCAEHINPGALRLALNPGMGGNMWFRSSSDYYHIPCFETLADFTQPTYLDLIQPLTRHTYHLRGLKPSSISDGSYLLPGGVERLLLEWKVTRGMAIDKRDGVFNAEVYRLDPDVHELLYSAGKRGFWMAGRPAMLDQYEYWVLLRMAINEWGSDSEGEGGWNLFEAFLGSEEDEGRHDLSGMLGRWERAVAIASGDVKENGDEEREGELSRTAIKAIRRLSIIPKPAGWM
ncbi:hypothetical protein BJX70DRAFT_129735 [Aspergillus crustosus]